MLGLNEIAATWHLLGCTCTNAMKRITRRKEVQQRRQLQMTDLADSNKQQEQQQWSFKCKSSSLPWPSTSSIQLQGHSRLVAELCSHPAAVQSKSARRQLSWGHCIQSGSKLAVGLFRIQDGHADKVKETQTHPQPPAPPCLCLCSCVVAAAFQTACGAISWLALVLAQRKRGWNRNRDSDNDNYNCKYIHFPISPSTSLSACSPLFLSLSPSGFGSISVIACNKLQAAWPYWFMVNVNVQLPR